MKLKQAYLTAVDPEGLARFYEAMGSRMRFADHGKWIQFVGDVTAFCVASPAESAADQSRNAVLVFEVDDLEAALVHAQTLGARLCGDVRDMGAHGRVADVRDPQNNTIQLFQATAK